MAIVMLATFHPEELPGVPPAKLFGLADVASYNDAWKAARRVMDNCISKYLTTNETMQGSGGGMNFRSETGWSPIGTLHLPKIFVRPLLMLESYIGSKGDIGVFLWDTSSATNQKIQPINLLADSVSSSNRPLQLANLTQSETAESRGSVLNNIT